MEQSHINNILRLVAVIVIASVAPEILLPEPNMLGCPYVGPCHVWPDFMYGLIFIFICVTCGPRQLPYQVLVFALIPFLGMVGPISSGEISLHTFPYWSLLLGLPWVTMVQGGVVGAILGHGIIYSVIKVRNKCRP